MKSPLKRYVLYLVRWQLSTPILAVCVWWLTDSLGATLTTIVANFIGGLIFFWVDLWIFRNTDILFTGELWEAQDAIACADCGKAGIRGYRLVKAHAYDKSQDKSPEFRCHDCSGKKYQRDRHKHTPTAN